MRGALSIAATALMAFAAGRADSQSTTQFTTAPPPAAPQAADFVVVSRIDNTQTVETGDTQLLLTKGKQVEHALVRRFIFITATLRTTEPAVTPEGTAPAPQSCRFAYRSFLQRQICFTSMSGLTSCTQPEINPLPDQTEGDAPAPANAQPGFCSDVFRPATTARVRLSSSLLSNAKALFAADQASKVDPMFKAAGVSVKVEQTLMRQQPARAASSAPPATPTK
jgi:hypothetical protein